MAASIKLGNATPTGIYVGSTQVSSIYLGSIRVWGSTAPVENLEISPSSLPSFSASGGSRTITVTSSGTWSVIANQDWITLSRFTGTNGQSVSVGCNTNSTFDSRWGTVTFSCGTLTRTVSVYQDGIERVIEVDPTSITSVPVNGGTYQFSITSNCDWDISSTPWITVSGSSSGSGNRSNIQITVAANTGAARTGSIWVSEDEGHTQAEITVSQAGVVVNPTVEVNAINWCNGYTSGDPNWLNKQSWQVKFVGGSSGTTYHNLEVFVQSTDTGQTIDVVDQRESFSVSANQTAYWGLNESNFANHNRAQLSYDGYTVDDEYVLTFHCDETTEETYFEERDIN